MREKFENGGVYHVFNRSIAGYQIFSYPEDYRRFILALKYYQIPREVSFSSYLKVNRNSETTLFNMKKEKLIVNIIGYCIMPTHIHIILQQIKDNGISGFMNNVLNSYTRYFNLKMRRKGPLWEGRFKSVKLQSDDQLLHLTRYIHLNPVAAYLVDKPELWEFSSYKEYCGLSKNRICNYEEILDIKPESYKIFVEDNIDFQRELVKIKKLLFEEI